MTEPRFGIADLIERVVGRCYRPWRQWFVRVYTSTGEAAVDFDRAESDMHNALRSIRGAAEAGAIPLLVPLAREIESRAGFLLLPSPHWQPLLELADVLARTVAVLESLPGKGIGLARACHADLTTLPVLADWCEDNGLPAAAAEARHLFSLLRVAHL